MKSRDVILEHHKDKRRIEEADDMLNGSHGIGLLISKVAVKLAARKHTVVSEQYWNDDIYYGSTPQAPELSVSKALEMARKLVDAAKGVTILGGLVVLGEEAVFPEGRPENTVMSTSSQQEL